MWIAGYWPGSAPFERAARWDGVAPLRAGHEFCQLDPDELLECVRFIDGRRRVETNFDVIFIHTTPKSEPELIPEYEAAGATWWLDATFPLSESISEFRERVLAGPPVCEGRASGSVREERR